MSGFKISDEAMIDHQNLPEDIILDILFRLPVPSLLRFKSVCKSWAALITDPTFITKHHNNAITCKRQLISHYKWPYDDMLAVFTFVRTNKAQIDMKVPPPCDTDFVHVVGSCHGLVCISLCPNRSVLVLWNPATREFRKLPKRQKIDASLFIGFGFEPQTGDYKIVRLFPPHLLFKKQYPFADHVDVYSKISDSWKEVDNDGLECHVNGYSPPAVVNGVIHWLAFELGAYYEDSTVVNNVIVSFSLRTDALGYIALPESDEYYEWQISVFEESSLSALVFPTDYCDTSKSIDIWVMKEYGVAESWIKQSSVGIFPGVSRPIRRFKNGDMILQNVNFKLLLYNPRTDKFEKLPLVKPKYVFDVHSYAESLVSVGVGI